MRIILNDLTKTFSTFYLIFIFFKFLSFWYHTEWDILYVTRLEFRLQNKQRRRRACKQSDHYSVNELFASAGMNFESAASMFAQYDIADHSHWIRAQHEIQSTVAVDTVFDVTIACWDDKLSFQTSNDSKCPNGTCEKFHFSVAWRTSISMLLLEIQTRFRF